jgi:NAD+ synthetase
MSIALNGAESLDAPLRDLVLEFSRQNRIAPLTPWFTERLDHQIKTGWFLPVYDLDSVADRIVHWLISYRIQTGKSTVILGMSGGVDSALTAALFKRAGYRVIGVTMPIHQNPEETERGIDACHALGIEHVNVNLTGLYETTLSALCPYDDGLVLIEGELPKDARIRRGNIRARLRMITLYNLASLHSGFVASTDNFSELLAGFWTLHGDVGDVSPIQSLLKSWEVPYLAMKLCVPEHTWRATPTDGLGVDAGDEAQFGCTYLEMDIMFGAMNEALDHVSEETFDGDAIGYELVDSLIDALRVNEDERAAHAFGCVLGRIRGSWFKRKNPLNIDHPLQPRLGLVQDIDFELAQPKIVRNTF